MMTKVPIWTAGRDLIEQLNVESLVDYAEKPETRMRNLFLIFRIFFDVFGFAEVRASMLLGNACTDGCCPHLAFVQTLSAV
jgi:hypothetical protein